MYDKLNQKKHTFQRICGSYCYMSRIVEMLSKVLRLGSTTYIRTCTCTVGRFSGTISNLSTHCTHMHYFDCCLPTISCITAFSVFGLIGVFSCAARGCNGLSLSF